jgi:hypothetical protein
LIRRNCKAPAGHLLMQAVADLLAPAAHRKVVVLFWLH